MLDDYTYIFNSSSVEGGLPRQKDKAERELPGKKDAESSFAPLCLRHYTSSALQRFSCCDFYEMQNSKQPPSFEIVENN